jgi:hypothetical protein
VSTEPGWVWVPGDEWAPAWVEWRVGGGLVGWVPLGPQGVATAFPGYRPRWCFVPLPLFSSPHFQDARIAEQREYAAYHAATAIPFRRGDWRRGPSVELIERAGGDVTTVPGTPAKALRKGDVRAERRVGPGTLPKQAPATQARRRPVPGSGDRISVVPQALTPMPPPPPGPVP